MIDVVINDVPIACINKAAIRYHVPATLIISVLKTENGRNGMMNKNVNGTYDLGPMQINSIWLSRIQPYGITQYDLQFNPGLNVEVGTWILSKGLAHEGILWTGVGDYHSHTDILNQKYNTKVRYYYLRINKYLSPR